MKSVNVSNSLDLISCPAEDMTLAVIKVTTVIPLYIRVVFLGLQQWRKQRSFKSASHSDIFTYHVAAFQLVWIFPMGFYLSETPAPTSVSTSVIYFFLFSCWHGENNIHVLTCVERYLAVVHPIVYMRLRNERGVRIRNISIACAWILSAVCSGIGVKYSQAAVTFLVPFGLCLVAVSFCSLSVLFVLVRPGPGDGVQDRDRVDPTKQKAFFTITAISVVLWLWFGGLISILAVGMLPSVSLTTKCAVRVIANIFNLPSSSVLPLLYLHRAGKLSGCFHQKS